MIEIRNYVLTESIENSSTITPIGLNITFIHESPPTSNCESDTYAISRIMTFDLKNNESIKNRTDKISMIKFNFGFLTIIDIKICMKFTIINPSLINSNNRQYVVTPIIHSVDMPYDIIDCEYSK